LLHEINPAVREPSGEQGLTTAIYIIEPDLFLYFLPVETRHVLPC